MTQPQNNTRHFWAAAVLIVWGAWALRLIDVMALPLFTDEVSHLIRIHDIMQGNVWAGLHQNKWLYGYLVAFLQPGGPEGPWIARCISALWGVIAVAVAVGLGRALMRSQAGLIAGLTLAVMPLAVFHDRQALVDPQLSALMALSLLLGLSLARRPRMNIALLLALTFALARLTKPPAVAFFPMPFAALILFKAVPPGRLTWDALRARLPLLIQPGLLMAAAAGAALAVTAWVYALGAQAGERPRTTHTLSLANTALGQLTTLEGVQRLAGDLGVIADIFVRYVTPFAVICLLSALLLAAVRGQHWRQVLYLIGPGLLFAAIPVIAVRPTQTDEIASRYLLPSAVPLAVLIAIGLMGLLSYLRPSLRGRIDALSRLALSVPGLLFCLLLITDPIALRPALTRYDSRVYYSSGITSGYYYTEMADYFAEVFASGQVQRLHVVGKNHIARWMDAYLGPRIGEFKVFDLDDEAQRYQLALWLSAGDTVYVIESPDDARLPDEPGGLQLSFEATVSEDREPRNIYRVVGAGPVLSPSIYRLLGREPEFMAADYDALAAALNAEPGQQMVLVYPYNHTQMLDARTEHTVSPLPIASWPLTSQAVQEALERTDLPDGQPFHMLTYDPPYSDPQRLIAGQMAASAYPQGQAQWFGLLNLQRYVAGPAQPDFSPIQVAFEEVIWLEAGALLDAEAAPGQPVRFAFAWRTQQPINDAFNVFTHIVAPDGTLIAQHDGTPGAGLLPTTAWPADERVIDRYAIGLPPELAPGRYEVRIGLYNPASGLRLRVTEADSGAGDYVLAGFINVQ